MSELFIPEEIRFKNWRELLMCILDCETTSLDTEAEDFRIIQFAAILMKGGQEFDRINVFINPERPLEEDTIRITGITDEDVQDAPTFKELSDRIYEFLLKGDVLCAFNADYDKAALTAEFRRIGYPFIKTEFFDPLIWEREKKGSRSNKQGDVAKRYGVGRMGETLHGEGSLHNAMVDVEVLRDIVIAAGPDLPYTLEDLIQTQHSYKTRQDEHREGVKVRKVIAAAKKAEAAEKKKAAAKEGKPKRTRKKKSED